MNVVWSELALDDIEEIGAWIARERPSTARAITLRILDAVESLEELAAQKRWPGPVVEDECESGL